MSQPFHIALHGVTKSYRTGDTRHMVLQNLDWALQPGETAMLLGASGSGKSTLVNLIAGLDLPDAGQILFTHGSTCIEWTALSDAARTRFRLQHIGVIYQFFNLIPTLTLWENISLPLDLAGAAPAQVARARTLMQEMGLAAKGHSLPQHLSGGEQQRAAIVRALVNEPDIILADEPTGNLDGDTSRIVMDLLVQLCAEHQASLLVATHAMELVCRAHTVMRLEHGRLAAVPP